MQLKRAHRPSPLVALARRRKAAALAAYTLLAGLVGAWAYRSGIVGDALLEGRIALEDRLVQVGALWRADPPVIYVDMQHEDFLRIAHKREEALARNLLVTGPEDFVPAEMRCEGEAVRVRMRLKGDLRDHWAGDKWSFRVDVRGDDTLRGMKRFSLQHPRTREYLWEWLYHRALAREGLPALRYEFVKLVFNGRDLGVYALEEHFERRLVEHRELREGPIVRFDESLSWSEAATQGFLVGERRTRGGAGSWYSSPVDGFDTGRWLADPAMRAAYERALALLDGFRDGELKTSDVFDVDKLAAFFAVTELFDAPHAAGWRNVRFYANPLTARLEPIGFDARGHGASAIRSLIYTIPLFHASEPGELYYEYAWFDALFKDRTFYLAYVAALERVAEPAYLDRLLADLDADMRTALDVLHTEFPSFRFWPGVVRKNQTYVRTVLNPVKGLNAWLVRADGQALEVELGNAQLLPLELLGLAAGDELRLPPPAPVEIAGKDPKRPVRYERFRFELPPGYPWTSEKLAELRVVWRLSGTTRVREDPFLPGPRPAAHAAGTGDLAELLLPAPDLAAFECLALDEPAGTVAFRPGSWRVERDLVLPAGLTVVCGPGTEIDLARGASIVSRSPLRFEGSEDEPIRVRSSQADGRGLVVLAAGGPSLLRHVVFEGLANPERAGWELTGAVTFYESDVRIERCAFLAARCEDALNAMRCDFDIEGTLFEGARGDAFDADFCSGRIAGSSFVASGNDAVDVSGSRVEIEGLTVDGAGDKGLSAGESSEVVLRDARIAGANVGVASKDLSLVTIEGLALERCRYGLAAYRKKSEFGPSLVRATGLRLANVDTPFLLEAGSRAEIDGEELAGERRDVVPLLYPAEEAP